MKIQLFTQPILSKSTDKEIIKNGENVKTSHKLSNFLLRRAEARTAAIDAISDGFKKEFGLSQNDIDSLMKPIRDSKKITVGEFNDLVNKLGKQKSTATIVSEIVKLPAQTNTNMAKTWVHGTDAIAEILSSREVWGGHAGIKVLGGDASNGVEDKSQPHHFFVAQTGDKGISDKPGNAYTKARQNAANKLQNNIELGSWKAAGYPLLGVLEFSSNLDSSLDGNTFEEKGEGIGGINTFMNEKGKYTQKLEGAMKPQALRLMNEQDMVNLALFLKANHESEDLEQFLPIQIRVLNGDNAKASDNVNQFLKSDNGFRSLFTTDMDSGWKTYNTGDVLSVIEKLKV